MRKALVVLAAVCALALSAGCGSAPEVESAAPPPAATVKPVVPTNAVTSAADSVGSVPGSADAKFVYRFRQVEPTSGSSGTFSFRDRDLSFSFRPSPNALYFQVENLQGRAVQLDWDRSVFYDAHDRSGKVGHNTTRWRDRFSVQTYTLIPPQQRYSDYVFSLDDLLDPGADAEQQLRRPLLPEDASATTYSGKTFGVDLVFMIENQPRTYTFRFQVQSVIPR
ncbi:MAG: hypothetical protein K8R56_08070 [Candidatus Eisenbacteria bacterium]|nr:hypothetical protein [Candidatus Eisenbacteria bacterium]